MPAFSVATNGDLACFGRAINVVACVDTLSRTREYGSPRKWYWKTLRTRNGGLLMIANILR